MIARFDAGASGDRGSGAIGALLNPRSIAIVGASDRSRWSQALVANLTRGGYTGALHLVNRRGGIVHGRAAATACTDIGAELDAAIVLVPAVAVPDAIDDIARAGATAALVLTSGFAETGAAGAAVQATMVARAAAAGVRLLGPNSLGFINFTGRVHAWTTPVRAPSRSRGTAIVSQSGATAYFMAELAWQQDIALSCVVATGNEADLDASAFLDHLVDDPDTRAIALFIETVRAPARFLAAARRALAAGKPVVALKVGASEATARAAVAHTGALVGDDAVFDGICRQFGMIRVHSIEALLATADIAGRTGVLGDGGLAIISNSGGVCEIAADSAARQGVRVPALDAAVAAHLAEAMPGFSTPHNPLDLTGGVDPDRLDDIVRRMAGQRDIAAVLCVLYPVPTAVDEESERADAVHRQVSAALSGIGVPGLLTSYTHTRVNDHARAIIERIGAPYCACGVDRAIAALAGVFWWSRMHRDLARAAPADVRADVAAPGSARPAGGERAALDYLASHGVPVVPSVLAADAAAAIAAARAFGGPVVLKIASPDIAHKSDIGGVALDVSGDDAVGHAFLRVVEAARARVPGAVIEGVLVAPMRERGVELIVGMARDPQWGPVLAVGLGGIWVEVLKDAALRVLPVDIAEVRRMLAELRGAPLLAGARGVPPANLEALAAAIARIAHAAACLGPQVAALDVNPLWVRGDRVEALDALLVGAPAAPAEKG
ncbi:MAG: acetate--CoA ligase family protein [Burkholderiales bacterium]|nr:acetate--CoA ligase family protein [Burkholderiales bacterium]